MENMFEYSGEDVVLPTEVYSEAALKDIQDLQDGINEGWDYIETCDGYSNELCSDTTLDEIVFINAGLEHISDRLDMVHVPAKIDMMRAMPNRMTRASVEGVGSGIKKAAIATYRAIRNTLRKLGRFLLKYIMGRHRTAKRVHAKAVALIDKYEKEPLDTFATSNKLVTDESVRKMFSQAMPMDSLPMCSHVMGVISTIAKSAATGNYFDSVGLKKVFKPNGDDHKDIMEWGRGRYESIAKQLSMQDLTDAMEKDSKSDTDIGLYDFQKIPVYFGDTILSMGILKSSDHPEPKAAMILNKSTVKDIKTTDMVALTKARITEIITTIKNTDVDDTEEIGDAVSSAITRMVKAIDILSDTVNDVSSDYPDATIKAISKAMSTEQLFIKEFPIKIIDNCLQLYTASLTYCEESIALYKKEEDSKDT